MNIRNSKPGAGSRPEAAIPLLAVWLTATALASAAEGYGCRQGYRQQSAINDIALGREWTVYVSCAHPESPRVAVLAEGTAATPSRAIAEPALGLSSAVPVVREGSTVRLWLNSPVAQIALSGMALENGALGVTIRVRVMPGGKVLNGTVRAPGSVELVAAGFDGAGQ